MMLARPFSAKRLLLLSSTSSSSQFRCPVLISHFYTCSSPSHRSNSQVEPRNVKVSVWWDFENCEVPVGVNVYRVAQTITAAVRNSGIKGPIQITAFGDVQQLPRANQEALSSTGISLTHIPSVGGKNNADLSLLVDLMYWVSQNPPPAHLFLISSDGVFASILHRLRMNNYNILLATSNRAPSVLYGAASIMWNWNALVKREKLIGRHFNHPPDGPYGSCYGHYKVTLEDPFTVVERPTCSKGQGSSEAIPEATTRQIPLHVMKQISKILNSYPKGISIPDLRLELAKHDVGLDEDLYGYKRFSKFLLSMPHILKLKTTGDGQLMVLGNIANANDQLELNPKDPVCDNRKLQFNQSSKSDDKDIYISGCGEETFPSSPHPILKGEESPKTVHHPPCPVEKDAKVLVQGSPIRMDQPSPTSEEVVELVNTLPKDHPSGLKKPIISPKIGVLKILRRLWYGSGDVSDIKGDDIPKESATAGDSSEKGSQRTLEKCNHGDTAGKGGTELMKSPAQDNSQLHLVSSSSSNCKSNLMEKSSLASEACSSSGRNHGDAAGKIGAEQMKSTAPDNSSPLPMSCSSSNFKSNLVQKTGLISEACHEKPMKSPGFFEGIVNWFKLWGNSSNSNAADVQPRDILKQNDSSSQKNDIFSKDTFWRDIESFIDTKRGSFIISQSSTRTEMAQNLQKEGPPVLRSLDGGDVLQFVDMLIYEKKWVEEHPSEASPFKLTRPGRWNTLSGDSQASNELSSIFMGKTSQSELSGAGVSLPVTEKNALKRSRTEVLADCRNLVSDILEEHPEGYNMATFRKLFRDRYGYNLDVKKLGYQKLTSLIQIMPGVKMEGNSIFPSDEFSKHSNQELQTYGNHASRNSDSELSNASRKTDDLDSSWEELSLVSDMGSGGKKLQSASGRTVLKETRNSKPDVSDDDFLETDGESLIVSQPSGKAKPGANCERSSFLEILDSWYPASSKEDGHKNEKPENAEARVACSTNAVARQDSSGQQGSRTDFSSGKYSQRQRPRKSYNFVADPNEDDSDKLLDGIMGSLKKSGELERPDNITCRLPTF